MELEVPAEEVKERAAQALSLIISQPTAQHRIHRPTLSNEKTLPAGGSERKELAIFRGELVPAPHYRQIQNKGKRLIRSSFIQPAPSVYPSLTQSLLYYKICDNFTSLSRNKVKGQDGFSRVLRQKDTFNYDTGAASRSICWAERRAITFNTK